jgi:hypothetical protein
MRFNLALQQLVTFSSFSTLFIAGRTSWGRAAWENPLLVNWKQDEQIKTDWKGLGAEEMRHKRTVTVIIVVDDRNMKQIRKTCWHFRLTSPRGEFPREFGSKSWGLLRSLRRLLPPFFIAQFNFITANYYCVKLRATWPDLLGEIIAKIASRGFRVRTKKVSTKTTFPSLELF